MSIKRLAASVTGFRKNYTLYLFLLPAVAYIVIFNYIPLYGIQIAFKDFVAAKGIWGSSWAGFKYFLDFFESYQFTDLIKNTLSISIYTIAVGFPMPVILALLINYTTMKKIGKFTQIVTYAPHFISTVVLVGMISVFFSMDGFVNQFVELLGGTPTLFLGREGLFLHLCVWSGVWQNTGWASIIYIATLAGISPELHEAAIMDGASKFQRIWNVDIPFILPTATILLILNMGHLMSVGFEKVFLMQNDVNITKSEILSTYVYKIGILKAQYSYSTAIGLFNNVINFILLVTVNKIAGKVSDYSLW